MIPEHETVVRLACENLVRAAPDGWARLDFSFRSTYSVDTATFEMTGADGRTTRLVTPMAVLCALGDLRTEMYQPGVGAWFTANLEIHPPCRYTIEFDYDSEPVFVPPLVPATFVEDLAAFPRDEAHIPGWLRERVS